MERAGGCRRWPGLVFGGPFSRSTFRDLLGGGRWRLAQPTQSPSNPKRDGCKAMDKTVLRALERRGPGSGAVLEGAANGAS